MAGGEELMGRRWMNEAKAQSGSMQRRPRRMLIS